MLTAADQQVRAVALGLRLVGRELRNEINRTTAREMNPVWKQLVQDRATGRMDTLVLAAGARVKGGNPPVLLAAQSRRPIGKARRLVPNEDWQGYEFGGERGAYSRYTRTSPNGVRHQVERRTARHLRPTRRQGYVIYPAVAEFGPRLAQLWVQTFVRLVYEASERKA